MRIGLALLARRQRHQSVAQMNDGRTRRLTHGTAGPSLAYPTKRWTNR